MLQPGDACFAKSFTRKHVAKNLPDTVLSQTYKSPKEKNMLFIYVGVYETEEVTTELLNNFVKELANNGFGECKQSPNEALEQKPRNYA